MDTPTLFRDKLQKELEVLTGKKMEIEIEETDIMKKHTRIIEPIQKIKFIPGGYQLSVDRRTIRRHPTLSEFHEWLKIQTFAGFITRQETVSMIPPVVLSVEPHHAVLDMCAAPGSKTSQILEIVSEIPSGENEPNGFVVANDSDSKRAFMMVNNLRRKNSPAVYVTSKDARFYPQLKEYKNIDGKNEGLFDRVLCDVPCSGDGTLRKNPGIWKTWNQSGALALHALQLQIALKGAALTKVGGYMCYSTCSMNPIENEAVVCEILRASNGALELVDKRPDMPDLISRPGWTSWKVLRSSKKADKNKKKKNSPKMIQKRKEWEEKNKKENSNEENTAEENTNENITDKDSNESTVETETKTKVKEDTAMDIDKTAPTKEEDGKADSNMEKPPINWDEKELLEDAKKNGFELFNTFDEVPSTYPNMRKSMFPPSPEEVEKFHLDRCMRCLPHDMDTGGFFITLFRKTKPMGKQVRNKQAEKKEGTENNEEENESVEDTEKPSRGGNEDEENGEETKTYADAKNGKQGKDGKKKQTDLGNLPFIIPDTETMDKFDELVNFYGLSPDFPKDQIMTRSNPNPKILYFIAKSIKEKLIDQGIQDRITVINSGVKVFERNKDSEVGYRIVQEGIHMIAPFLGKRKFVVDFQDFVRCLSRESFSIDLLSETFKKEIEPLPVGAFAVVLEGYENDHGKKMLLVMWRRRSASVNRLVGKTEIDGMKSKLRAIAELNNIEYNLGEEDMKETAKEGNDKDIKKSPEEKIE